MIIKIHSIIDVITNSSTVTYVMANDNTIKMIKDLIKALVPGSDPDQLFTFSLVNEKVIQRRKENIENELSNEDPMWDSYDYKKCDKLIDKKYEEYNSSNDIPEWWNDYESEYMSNTYVEVAPKSIDKNIVEAAKILSQLHELFDYDSERDG